MKYLLQIGAGNIGRACVGRLFHNAGYFIYFSDVNLKLLDLIQQKKAYSVRMVDQDTDQVVIVDNVDAFDATQEDIHLKLDVITTAVGVPILPKIAPLIAKIISNRYQNHIDKALNIIACENSVRASTQLKKHVYDLLDPQIVSWCQGIISFPDAATDCIVPMITDEDPLLVTSENFAEIVIEKPTFLGEPPKAEGLEFKDNLDAYIERKLFTLNTGHAITAYYGIKKGYTTIKQAITDPQIKEIVKNAMKESGDVLIARYGFSREEHEKYINKIISRFENPYLDDSLERVGRDPLRKLSRNDRLIKPILGAIEYNLPYANLVIGVKAALTFKNDNDESSIQMHKILESPDGIEKITGLVASDPSEKIVIQKISE